MNTYLYLTHIQGRIPIRDLRLAFFCTRLIRVYIVLKKNDTRGWYGTYHYYYYYYILVVVDIILNIRNRRQYDM